MPSHDAAYTNCQPQTRWPRILRQTVQTLPGVPTRNASAARPAVPGTSTSTSGSCLWSLSFSISPGHYPHCTSAVHLFPAPSVTLPLLGCIHSLERSNLTLTTCTILH